MHYVMDCSFSSALFLPDENSDTVGAFFNNLNQKDTVIVPLLWWYETNNVLQMSIKRQRLNHTQVIDVLQLLSHLSIETDTEFGMEFSKEIIEIAHMYGLSSYDAVYCELAVREKAKLLTLDKQIISAAKEIGIETG